MSGILLAGGEDLASVAARYGSNFGNVFKTFPGAARGTADNPGIFAKFGDFLNRLTTGKLGIATNVGSTVGTVAATKAAVPLSNLFKSALTTTSVVAASTATVSLADYLGSPAGQKTTNLGSNVLGFFQSNPIVLPLLAIFGIVMVIKK